MSGFEWFLLIVVVILVPLIVAVMITLWTLEQARKRNRKNREEGSASAGPVKRRATREPASTSVGDSGSVDRQVDAAVTEIAMSDSAITAPADEAGLVDSGAYPLSDDNWQRTAPTRAEVAESETTTGPTVGADDSESVGESRST